MVLKAEFAEQDDWTSQPTVHKGNQLVVDNIRHEKMIENDL